MVRGLGGRIPKAQRLAARAQRREEARARVRGAEREGARVVLLAARWETAVRVQEKLRSRVMHLGEEGRARQDREVGLQRALQQPPAAARGGCASVRGAGSRGRLNGVW